VPAEQEVGYPSVDGVTLRATWHPADGEAAVVMAHGITGERDEGGLFSEMAERLGAVGVSSLRFDFRAHGASGGAQEEMTVNGEIMDFAASLAWLSRQRPARPAFVAASFGAVSVCQMARLFRDLPALVLLNPVLDPRRTFLEPETDWPRASFNSAGFAHLEEHGFLWLDGRFKIGRQLAHDLGIYRPYERFQGMRAPVLIIHGDADTCVPYAVSAEAAQANPNIELVTVPGADHGFGRPHERQLVLDKTMEWLLPKLSRSLDRPRS